MQEIDEKMTKIRAQGVNISDTSESYMAELRVDIDDMADHLTELSERIRSAETIIYNYKLWLTILSVFVFILYIIK